MSMPAAKIIHPVMQEMVSTGCKNQKAISLAFQTYMELCEVEILWNVEYHFSEELDLIYLSAADKPNGDENLYVPVSYLQIITPEWILEIRKQMEKRHENSIFTFVIRSEDSTSVHYKISPGLVAPLSPDAAKHKKLSDEKRQLFEHEIKKRKCELIASAKKGSKNSESARDKTESIKDKISQETSDCNDDVCEVPITVTIDDDDGDSNQTKQVEVIEL
ncbi:hypothetical protein LSTR_LSTR001951 [Laodelphax striatellus]|uniref:tRNA-splicing endonuclease subunit Sen15 domain-containing protein n=1 Tax=Laodelphax striatellus TaxID=195883 RepID=A0A482XHI5_LAOST|nr:hypothetical protein LSTR_LSTR001951 [Laodelphax striatellus]